MGHEQWDAITGPRKQAVFGACPNLWPFHSKCRLIKISVRKKEAATTGLLFTFNDRLQLIEFLLNIVRKMSKKILYK